MQFNRRVLKTVAATTLLLTTLNAADVEGIIELKYGIADGKATSYTDSASDTTQAISVSFGAKQNNYNTRTLLNYKPIRWKDAEADLMSASIDYIYALSPKTELFAGVGLGVMKYKAQDMQANKTVYTLQAGAQYRLTEHFYTMLNINYIDTNNLKIQKNQYIYSELENMLSAEIGVGYSF